jgi:hypothetical protein
VDTEPKVLDQRLELTLFAENPDIVTPVGIAVDSLDRVFVLESNTHTPPKDYQGPDSDLIKIFRDTDDDGRADRISIYASGFFEGLNITFSPEGILYVVTSREVWALYDHDGDGVSDDRKKVLALEKPASVYAHAALLGITFSNNGWMYVSRGNTGGASWKLVGTDGSYCSGYGDGGNIVRARPDGTSLEEIATGFWNPADIKFEEHGALMVADNDPDSRGPNRLVHVVRGGDYGYKSLYGGSGIHPYLAWNGELPGTLPYVVGLGEAPSGLLDAGLAALPSDYTGQMLATIWEESRIVRIALSRKGKSFEGTTEVIVEGDAEFRPVAFATDRKGNIYFTDWVLRDYPNHGRGKIWKLNTRPEIDVVGPRKLYAKNSLAPTPDRLLEFDDTREDADRITRHLTSEDPYIRHAAITKLQLPEYLNIAMNATKNDDANVRLGAMVALEKSGYKNHVVVRRLLEDSDVRIRKQALIWIGRQGITELRIDADRSIFSGPADPVLFDVYLATIRHLSPDFITAYANQSEEYSKSLRRSLPDGFLEHFISDKSNPPAFRALAVRYLNYSEEHVKLLRSLVGDGQDESIRIEAIRTLSNTPGAHVQEFLSIARNTSCTSAIRAEAIAALGRLPDDFSKSMAGLLSDLDEDVAIEAARYIRAKPVSEEVSALLKTSYEAIKSSGPETLREQLELALTGSTKTVLSEPELMELVGEGGDPDRGRRVFFSNLSTCSSCHAVESRGGDLGPELTRVAQSKSRKQFVHSILEPGDDISPEYQGWFIRLKDGKEFQGRQIDIGGTNIELYTYTNGNMYFRKDSIEMYGMLKGSLMPGGLMQRLTMADLRDLLAYLESTAQQ